MLRYKRGGWIANMFAKYPQEGGKHILAVDPSEAALQFWDAALKSIKLNRGIFMC